MAHPNPPNPPGRDSQDNVVALGDPRNGKFLRNLDVAAQSVSFTADGKSLCVRKSASIDIVELTTGKTRLELKEVATALTVCASGKWLAGITQDGKVRVWNIAGKEIKEACRFDTEGCKVTTLAFSPDGKHLAAGSEDTTVLVWQVEKREAEKPAKTDKKPKLPEVAQRILEKAEQLELFSLDPWSKEGGDLGYTTVRDADVCKDIRAALYKGIEDGNKKGGNFKPRHGIRATHDGKAVAFVICFHTNRMEVHVNDRKEEGAIEVWTVEGTPITEAPESTLDKILKDAKVPLAPKPKN